MGPFMLGAWGVRLAKVAATAMVLAGVAMGALWHAGNKAVSAPKLAQRQAHLHKAIGWVIANEAKLMQNSNSALWHMLARTAEITRDAELSRIVERARNTFFSTDTPQSPWVRMLRPGAAYVRQLVDSSQLDDYQAAFLSAITCGETEMAWSGLDGWRTTNQCHPLWRNTVSGDMFCTTHQLMSLQLLKQTACPNMHAAEGLTAELVSDAQWMLRVDPIVKDAYIQRVLTLMWVKGESAIEPIWLQRVMDAQQDDGGWMGRAQLPDLPKGWQLWDLRQALAHRLPSLVRQDVEHTDFHASAQGVYLMALAVQAASQAAPR